MAYMVEIISKSERSLTDAGDSKRVSVAKDWLEILGFKNEKTVVTAVLKGKHGFFFGAWIEGDQPDLDQFDTEELEDLTEKVDIVESK